MLRELVLATQPIRYVFDRLTFQQFGDRAALEKWRNRYAGKTMLVVGNGPSLNQTPLDDFAGVPAIGMNKIDILFPRVKWRPSLIVCVNNLVVQQHSAQFAHHELPVFLSWKARWFMPRKAPSVSYFLSLSDPDFQKDIVDGVGTIATVTYTALQFAYFMGARTVILFGVDHSFKAAGKSYEIVKRKGDDVDHFDPNYFKAGSYWGIPNLEESEQGYLAARDAFEADGRKIYDATIGGKLQIFEKISLERARALVSN
jgi:hypothetical protein